MLELLLCSMLTIFPDYLYRRYVQGKRIGQEITLYSMWYELRWGISACLILTVSLITMIFYFHPSTKAVTAVFRTVTILPEPPAGSMKSLSASTKRSPPARRSSASTIHSRKRHLKPPVANRRSRSRSEGRADRACEHGRPDSGGRRRPQSG